MGRKNYRDKDARQRHVVTYTPVEIAGDYSVLMTNGSGVKRITVTGSKVSAWTYAVRLGLNENDPVMPGVWYPLDIEFLRENDEAFTAL
jgi:hypothetical protein